MSRRVSTAPQTPLNTDDALERSLRRQRSSTRPRESLADVARRVNESPVPTPDSSMTRRRFSGRFIVGDGGAAPINAPVSPGDFQEWMKMVRLKRVKANNAFTIQLIDCFHNMVQGASFQEATHTLGGCLTVYKNRIASVKDDTSKLLVGVSEKKSAEAAQSGRDDEDDADDDDDGDAESSHKRAGRKRRRVPTGADSFLVPAEKLEIDTNELATTIDPLLRKMSADFDKRGAGALLQYSLKQDNTGRLLLDAEAADGPSRPRPRASPEKANFTNDRKLESIAEEDEDEMDTGEPNEGTQSTAQNDTSVASGLPVRHVDLAHFNVAFFANVDLSVCEAVPNIDSIAAAVSNPEEGTDALVRNMRTWALNDPSDTSIYVEPGQDTADADAVDVPLDEEVQPDAFEQAPELGLGFALENDIDIEDQHGDVDDTIGGGNSFGSVIESSLASVRPPPDGNWLDIGFLRRVDAQQSNWAGPSFWKLRRLQARDAFEAQNSSLPSQPGPSKSSRKVAKVPAVIDFLEGGDVDADSLFAPGKSAIYMPARQYDESDTHLLPVDMRVTTAQLVDLSLRPHTGVAPAFMREAWSIGNISGPDHSQVNEDGPGGPSLLDDGRHDGFFYGGWDDVDVEPAYREQRPQTASAMFTQSQTQQFYGSQRHQLNYARVAKHVDVRKLKDNVWHAISNDAQASEDHATTLLNVIHETQPQYTEQQRADLSPAMYFISLLHLSNEKGMKLENTEELTDVRILANQAT